MAFDFPSAPTNGQQFGNYYWDAATGAWRNLGSKDALAQRLTSLEAAPAGLVRVVPSSVAAVSSGTASVNSTGVVSFSGVGGIQLNSLFTSAFRNYRVLLNYELNNNTNISLRFANSGIANSNSSYFFAANWAHDSGNVGGLGSGSGGNQVSRIQISYGGFTGKTNNTAAIDVFDPTATSTMSRVNFHSSTWNTYLVNQTGTGMFNANQGFDGLQIFAETGGATFTGTLQVYGYRN